MEQAVVARFQVGAVAAVCHPTVAVAAVGPSRSWPESCRSIGADRGIAALRQAMKRGFNGACAMLGST